MFGYVIADLGRLTEAQRLRYHSVYCGLCRALYADYGAAGALALTYDMTFLTLLLAALYEPEERSGAARCLRHPVRAQQWASSEFTAYAAAMNCLLAWENCRDDWADEKKLSAAAAGGMLAPGAKKAAARYPEKAAAIRRALGQIAQAEADRTGYSETPANAFGDLMAELFTVRDDRWTDGLRRFARSLGKLIYFMDAACDLQADRKKGSITRCCCSASGAGRSLRRSCGCWRATRRRNSSGCPSCRTWSCCRTFSIPASGHGLKRRFGRSRRNRHDRRSLQRSGADAGRERRGGQARLPGAGKNITRT